MSAPGNVNDIQIPPSSFGTEVFKQGLELYKRQSMPLFILAFGEIAFGFILAFLLPSFLKFVIYFLTPVVSIGVLRCLRFLDQHQGKATLSETFKYFYDDSRRMDYLPLCVISLLASGLTHIPGAGFFSLGGIVIMFVEALVALAFFYGVPLVEFNRLPAKEALVLSFQATTRNWKSLTVYGLLFVLYGFLSLVSLGIGLLFLIPISAATRFYFWQISFDPAAAEASAKRNQQTPSPSDDVRDVTPQA